MEPVLDQIRGDLLNLADEKVRESGKRFFKEEVKTYGIKTATVSKLAKDYFNILKHLGKEEMFNLCEALWKSGYMEESFIACEWSYKLHKSYEPEDFRFFERWLVNYVTNWAACDTLCNHTIGKFIEMYPGFLSALKAWTKSENRWVRRGAAVSLIIPARKGIFLEDILGIANSLLTDSDDMVQKGYGWMLKAASQVHQVVIFDYVQSKKHVMPRTALRYAIEKMPVELKALAMEREKINPNFEP
jgi:3-methyladenine DNA glycosylase AlkD